MQISEKPNEPILRKTVKKRADRQRDRQTDRQTDNDFIKNLLCASPKGQTN